MLPSFVNITTGKVADVKAAREISIPSNSVVVADRGYEDYDLLSKWEKAGIKFVIRIKASTSTLGMKEKPLPDGKNEHILITTKNELTTKSHLYILLYDNDVLFTQTQFDSDGLNSKYLYFIKLK